MSSSSGDHDVEAAKADISAKATKSRWSIFKRKSTNSVELRPQPTSTQVAADSEGCGVEYGLMKRTSELRNAVEAGNAALAAEVIDCLKLQKSAGFTIQDVSGNGLLQISALKNNLSMTIVLLDKGFGINDIDSNHGTALQAAIYMNQIDVIKVLLDENRDVKVDVNTAGGYYGCALQVAAFKGSADLCDKLLKLGADVCIRGGKYDTVLQAAARTGLPSIVQRILDAIPHSQRKQLINAEGGVYGTALQAAAKGDYTGQTRYLRRLSRGRVLRHATKVPRTTSTEKINYPAVAKLLVENHAKVKCDGGRLGSPVGAAASSGKLDMLEFLVEHDETPIDQRRVPYSCALISAITQTFVLDRLPLVRLLVEKGADVNFETGSGLYNRPLTAAAAMNAKSVMEYLLEKAKDRTVTINAESGIYGSALRAALSAGAQKSAIYLIEEGAAISTTEDQSFGNVLHLAVFSKMDKVVEILLDDEHVGVDLRDDAGQTALHIAAYRGYEGIVSTLLRYHANPDLVDAWGDTPHKIVEDVIERESHPGPSLEDLRKIKQHLLEASARQNKHIPGDLVHGPPIVKKSQVDQSERGTAKPVFSSPIWNPGLSFNATIVDFLEKDGDEYLSIKSLSIDDLLYRKNAVAELMPEDPGYTRNLRWYHIPSNNMTWAKMLIKMLWTEKHPKVACKSFWGTDPYFVSPDLAPHARFVTPQCERLIPDAFVGPEPPPEVAEGPQNTLFLAMPYLHWESYRSAEAVSDLLDEIKEDSLKTRILRGGKTWRTHEANPKPLTHRTRARPLDPAEAKDSTQVITVNEKPQDDDDELLRKYLFKRWPIHLRRTLDQYYYSYLADTRTRDGDQVVMRVRNEELYKNELAINSRYYRYQKESVTGKKQKESTRNNWKAAGNKNNTDKEVVPETTKDKEIPKYKNSPIVMVDQLWLWVLDHDTIVTCFPRRRMDKEDGDLDTEDKTDVLETMLRYLRSAKRHPVQDAYDLSEVIISQCVGILHRSDVIPDLDFLKIFGSEADRRVDEVMTKLTKFVHDFKEFMEFVNQTHRISDLYIKRFEKIFSVTKETLLLREIQDIKDELNMLKAVFEDQRGVLEKAGKDIAGDRQKSCKTRSSAFNFQQQSEKHARHIERMHVQATQAYNTLKDLLDLKQQQANVLEARVNRNQAIAAKEQGKTIMVFTIVTIIFLPLTFMTTVFTLPVLGFQRWDPNDQETPKADGMLKMGYTFRMIAGVTLAMAIPLIITAFQVKRLQRWWEEGQALMRIKRMEQKLEQDLKEKGNINSAKTM